MQTIDVPQSASMFRYLEQKDWAAAHSVACLGVTEGDWRALALAALEVGGVGRCWIRGLLLITRLHSVVCLGSSGLQHAALLSWV